MTQSGWKRGSKQTATIGWLLVMVGILGLSRAGAAEVEYRDFKVLVDQKQGGEYHLTIDRQDDGKSIISCQADVLVNYLKGLYKYTYTYRGTETWQNGRLMRLESTANDDGTALSVKAAAEGNGLRVNANGKERITRWDVWSTSYWHAPDARYHNKAIVLLDADTGKEIVANLTVVGTNAVTVGGQAVNCTHFRLTGGVQVDLWYDGQERMVRQETVEQGHRTILELVRLRH